MKRICLFLPLMLAVLASHASTPTGYVFGARMQTDCYDEWGTRKGYSTFDSFSGRTKHYNEWGSYQGYSERDKFSGNVKHYDEWGRLKGAERSR